jgi:PAS domain S-box-containing protein
MRAKVLGTQMKVARYAAASIPYLAYGGTAALAAMLLAAISFTSFNRGWTIFLAGVLTAAVLAATSRFVNARWIIRRRISHPAAAPPGSAAAIRQSVREEKSSARVRANARLIDESFPAMLTYVDAQERVRYHNRAYTRWIGLEGDAIDGQRIDELIGAQAYSMVEARLKEAMQGRDVRYERTQTMPDGSTCRLHVQYLPHYASDGTVEGVFTILTDITSASDLADDLQHEKDRSADAARGRLVSALAHDEFTLFSQPIAPLGSDGGPALHEVLLRMNAEEDHHLSPGAFLPAAEELGLLHEIDRWVVAHVVDFVAQAGGGLPRAYFVNLAATTIDDPAFARFVRATLDSRSVDGRALCFELTEAEVLSHATAYRDFVTALEGTGCRFAVSGFGCDLLSLRFLQQLHVNFLKVDGGVIFNVLRKPAELARVKAVNQAAHAAGMWTIAECVESESTRSAVERSGTDYAQGNGIGEPGPMSRLDDPVAARP